ncbi:MAG: hypothetical protein RSG79_03590 [Pseudomonas sp.]
MKKEFVMVLMLSGLISGCSHYFNSPYGDPNDQKNIPCDASPPNQPGCYDKQGGRGLLNQLFDV